MSDITITITVAADGIPTVRVVDTPITVAKPTTRTDKRGSMFTAFKRDVLHVLKARRHKKTTRKFLARELRLTDSQVYNSIHQLRADGWEIHSQPGSATGYRLVG